MQSDWVQRYFFVILRKHRSSGNKNYAYSVRTSTKFFTDFDTTTLDPGYTTTNFLMRSHDDPVSEALEASRQVFISTLQQGKRCRDCRDKSPVG